MAFGEIYTGLQAGVIDGLEHDAPTVLSAKFYEAWFKAGLHVELGKAGLTLPGRMMAP